MLNCNHKSCVSDALQHAESVCAESGTRLTPIRRSVLELLWKSHQPRKAYDILSELGSSDKTAKPPTVYRALDFLQEMGLVHKVETLNAFIGCNGQHDHQYLVCQDCGDVADIHDKSLAKSVQKKAGEKGFQVTSSIIEIKGHCEKCLATA
jgi:Fur family zinc uptake transcriptional regulator